LRARIYVRLSLDSMKFVRGKDTTSVDDDYTVAVAANKSIENHYICRAN